MASTVEVRPVFDDDVMSVAEFLNRYGEEIGGRVPPDAWANALLVRWKFDAPNHGFMLVVDEIIVGVYIAFYSERIIDGRVERFCNFAMWCVAPNYRHHSMRLMKALLDQPGYHFTDLTPSAQVVEINRRFGFQALDTCQITIPTFSWPWWPERVRVTSARDEIEDLLDGTDLDVYRDHAAAAKLLQLVVLMDGQTGHLIFRKPQPGRVRRVPFLRLLYVNNSELFRQAVRSVGRHLLFRYGAREIRAEIRLLNGWTADPSEVRLARPKRMFRSASLRPDQIDYLYSGLSQFDGLFNRLEQSGSVDATA